MSANESLLQNLLHAIPDMPQVLQDWIHFTATTKATALHIERERESGSRLVQRRVMMTVEDTTEVEEAECHFLEPPAQDTVHECYQQMFQATSNSAMAFFVCAVCAHHQRRIEANLTELSLDHLPNKHRLVPTHIHSAYQLTCNMLLAKEGCKERDGHYVVSICHHCLRSLQGNIPHPSCYACQFTLAWTCPH